jgi:ribonuclease Z
MEALARGKRLSDGYGCAMDLDVVFLGTGGSVPTARRATACVLVRAGGERLLFDCGEGAQRQMQKSTGLVQVDEIYLTHYHADHYLGIPGLLKTYDLHDREAPLRVIGPPGLRELFAALQRITGRVRYPLELVELGADEAIRHESFEIRPFPVEHRVPTYGYAFVEDGRPGRFDPEEAERLGVAPGPDFARLQAGETVDGSAGPVEPAQVMGEARRGRKVVISGDTAPCELTRVAAHEAELLVHDASFADEELARAGETAHSTARQAARIGREAGVKALALVHISSRYHVGAVLDEARAEFPAAFAPRDFDLVEIPFPERGEPRVVQNGARESQAAAEAPAEPA